MLPVATDFGLQPGVVIAVPDEGLVVYRLIGGAAPAESDFQATRPEKAAERELPEILRVGYSAYLTVAAARRVRRRPESQVARVRLPRSPIVHVAKTLGRDHVTVWAPPQICVASADVLTDEATE